MNYLQNIKYAIMDYTENYISSNQKVILAHYDILDSTQFRSVHLIISQESQRSIPNKFAIHLDSCCSRKHHSRINTSTYSAGSYATRGLFMMESVLREKSNNNKAQ